MESLKNQLILIHKFEQTMISKIKNQEADDILNNHRLIFEIVELRWIDLNKISAKDLELKLKKILDLIKIYG